MNKKLHKIADSLNYCCVYKMFKSTGSWPTKSLATELGVTPRCIRARRHDLRTGKLKCPKVLGCQEPNEESLFLHLR